MRTDKHQKTTTNKQDLEMTIHYSKIILNYTTNLDELEFIELCLLANHIQS